jgi:hypothetical protein
MATTHDTLSVVSISDPNELREYTVLIGKGPGAPVWGWAGVRVDIDDAFVGYQVVQWLPGNTYRTTLVATWQRFAWFLQHPGYLTDELSRTTWEPTNDPYAADVLGVARQAEVAAKAAAAEVERAAAEAERVAAAGEHSKLALARNGGRAVYVGSMKAAHGACHVLGFCDCDECDRWPYLRLALSTHVGRLEHVRLSSIELS